MIDQDKPIDVSYRWALRQLFNRKWWWMISGKASALLQAGRSANLVNTNNGQVRFYHQLIQEYFASIVLDRIGIQHKLYPPTLYMYGTRISNKWDEVLISSVGITAKPDENISKIAKVDTYLAAKCIASGVDISATQYTQVVDQILNDNLDPMYAARTILPILAEIKETRAIPYLLTTGASGGSHQTCGQ
jgi:hypothetical protein